MIDLAPLFTAAPDKVEALLDRAFEPTRRQRTAYKVRGNAAPIAALSFAAFEDGRLVGTVQCWPVCFRADAGDVVPLVMVGPVAVEPTRQRGGLGRRLMDAALAAAGDRPLVLIGDPDYYARFFGFSAERTGGWRLPGPFERHRLLARGKGVPAESGELGPL